MAIQIDDDWKKQAQEEKRKLAEEAKAREEAAAASRQSAASGSSPDRKSRELPPADFISLIQTMLTQVGYYLGEYAGQDGEPMVDLDGAKFQIDLLGVLEGKTKGNLSPTEQATLDSALYELRSRYVSIATQMIR